MALIPHTFFPRSLFDMDAWFKPTHHTYGTSHTHHNHGPTTLDVFDPFDELDRTMSRNMQWLNKPAFLNLDPFRVPKVPQKYRINLDCRGYSPKSIKTEIKDGKLFVTGSEQHRKDNGDFAVREFHKTYTLPEEVDSDKLVSFMTTTGHLVIELPFRNHGLLTNQVNEALFPKIVDENGTKNVALSLTLPKNLDPAKISVTCKDHDVIIKGEDKFEKPDGFSQTYYYQRTTLPENTDLHSLKCVYDTDHHLSIKAPLLENAIGYQPQPQPQAIKK
jgi:HSP20 family molecular chaperone IbpA